MARHRPRPPVGGPPRGDHPVRLRALRRDERGDDRERHHLPAAARRARGGQGARPPAGLPRPPRQGRPRLGLPGRGRGCRRGISSGPAPTSRTRGSGASPRSGTRSSGSRAISASTRAAWCSRGAARRGGAARAGDDAGPRRRPVGQGRLRRSRDHQGRPARPRDDGGARGGDRALPGRRPRGRPRTSAARRPGGVSAPPGGGHGRASSRWRAGPRWRRSRASGPGASTTWSSRWRSSGPARSSARWSTRTSRGGRAASRSSIRIPRSSRSSRRTLGVPLFQEQLLRMGDGRGRLHRRRGGGAAPGLRLPALASADADDRGEAPRGHRAERDHRARRRGDRARDHRVRASTASPRVTPRASRCSPTRARTSRCTTPPSSTRRSSTTSRWASTIRRRWSGTRSAAARRCGRWTSASPPGGRRSRPARVRLGLGQVKGLRETAAARLVAARQAQAFTSVDDLAARGRALAGRADGARGGGRAGEPRAPAPGRALAGRARGAPARPALRGPRPGARAARRSAR